MPSSAKSAPDLKLLIALGVPSFGLTFAVTMLSAYMPSLMKDIAGPIQIGLIIGAEGFFGLFMPLIMGTLADRSDKVSDRFRYLVPTTILMAASLCLMGLFHILFFIGIMVALFYIAYYSYLAPYWAIYPDLIPKEYSGRSRSAESAWRVTGALLALMSGGFLLSLWKPLPFILAAGLVGVVTFGLITFLHKLSHTKVKRHHQELGEAAGYMWRTLRTNRSIRNLVIANALWNATLRSILTYTVLFFTVGLGRSQHFVSGVIFPIAAIGMVVMAPLSGKLADKYGHIKVLTISLLIYGFGDLSAGFTQASWLIGVVPLVSGAAATVMTLPYAVLMRILHGEPHGAASGIFGVSRGIGSFLGPLITGVAIVWNRSLLSSTHGYAAFWIASGAYILISLFFVRGIHFSESA